MDNKRSIKEIESLIRGDVKAQSFLKVYFDYPDLIEKITKRIIDAVNDGKPHVKLGLDECLKIVGHIEKWIEHEKEFTETKELNQFLIGILKEAYEAYHSEAGRQDKRARNALRILGLTTGKRPEKFNKDQILSEYIHLISSGTLDIEDLIRSGKKPKPMDKWDAIEFLTKKHGIASKEACFELLKRAIKKRKEECEKKGESHGWKNLLPWIAET